jgi:leader peptidase (prepilin peptidase)/N-methyltransferase
VEEPVVEAGAVPLVPPLSRPDLIAAIAAGLVILSFAIFGFEARACIFAFGAATLVVLSAIDIEHRVLPNRIVLPAIAIVLAAQLAFYPDDALESVLAGLAAGAFLGFPLVLRRDAMGIGDIKLAVLLGVIVGWAVFGAIILGCLALLPFALYMRVRDGTLRDATLPFGPFLSFGTLLVMFLGNW